MSLLYRRSSGNSSNGSPHYTDLDTESDKSGDESCLSSGSQAEPAAVRCWTGWPIVARGLIGLLLPVTMVAGPLLVGGIGSGTESPVRGLQQMLGEENVQHFLSCERSTHARKFILQNFDPPHFYKDVVPFSEGRGICKCGLGQSCESWKQPLDIVTAGFPCKPFSGLNIRRWTTGYNPFNDKNAAPFYAIVKWLRSPLVAKPKIVVLENVKGLMMSMSNCAYKTPLDFIMNGIHTDKKGRKQYKKGAQAS